MKLRSEGSQAQSLLKPLHFLIIKFRSPAHFCLRSNLPSACSFCLKSAASLRPLSTELFKTRLLDSAPRTAFSSSTPSLNFSDVSSLYSRALADTLSRSLRTSSTVGASRRVLIESCGKEQKEDSWGTSSCATSMALSRPKPKYLLLIIPSMQYAISLVAIQKTLRRLRIVCVR